MILIIKPFAPMHRATGCSLFGLGKGRALFNVWVSIPHIDTVQILNCVALMKVKQST